MRQSQDNPANNQLPQGMKEPALIQAIETSGYPLQGIVIGKLLKQKFFVNEEWGYIDRATKEHRSLDVIAIKSYHKPYSKDNILPEVALLIECKRSKQPFVFFKSVIDQIPQGFPTIAGTRSQVSIRQSQGGLSRDVSTASALGLDQLPFVKEGPRCVWHLARPYHQAIKYLYQACEY